MRLLFASDRFHVPDDYSGSVQSTHTLVKGLAARGHECRVLATIRPGMRHHLATLGYRLSLRRVIAEWEDAGLGYPVRRGSEWRFAERLARELGRHPPDVLFLDAARQVKNLERSGVVPSAPIILVLHELSRDWDRFATSDRYEVTYVANSPFTANEFRLRTGLKALVVSPAIDTQLCVTTRPSAPFVTLISPTHDKGIRTALHLAATFRETPFLLVQSRPMSSRQWRGLQEIASGYPNVVLSRAVGDIRVVYRKTKVLLVPSIVQETFGRVVVEAQASGIPILARDIGALSWVVGSGGITVAADAPDFAWEQPLRNLLECGEAYEAFSANARANALRPEFDLDHTLDTYQSLLCPTLGSPA